MKLGFLLFDYFPYGGLQRDCLKIASLCASRGHSVTMFTRTWQGERPSNIRVELFGRSGMTNVARNRAWIQQLNASLPQHQLDGVIGFNKLPNLDLYYGSDPCYVDKTDRLKPSWYKWLPRFEHFKSLEESVFRKASSTQILLLTPHEIPIYQKRYGTDASRFHLLPPGIERSSYSEEQRLSARTAVRQKHGWTPETRLLLLVGSGFRVKGLDRAIRALASLPADTCSNTHLVVIGQNRPGEFARLARRFDLGDRVHFLGGRSDVRDWLLAADLCIHPAYSEAAGMILLESMTAGLPILTTDVCGYAFHVVKAQAGVVLPSPFSQGACDRALAEMLASDQSPAWRANGLAYAAREDLYSCHERAADIIQQTIAEKEK
jgi:UDP-glucose:(heptosyl)LPS alpha-1,3-glucosyltransferase